MSNITSIDRQHRNKINLTDGNDYYLNFTLNVFADLEEEYGSVDKAFESVAEGKMKDIRHILWHGVQLLHPELTEHQLGGMIDISDIPELSGTLAKAMASDAPSAEEEEQDEVKN